MRCPSFKRYDEVIAQCGQLIQYSWTENAAIWRTCPVSNKQRRCILSSGQHVSDLCTEVLGLPRHYGNLFKWGMMPVCLLLEDLRVVDWERCYWSHLLTCYESYSVINCFTNVVIILILYGKDFSTYYLLSSYYNMKLYDLIREFSVKNYETNVKYLLEK